MAGVVTSFCGACGTEVGIDDAFCPHCGASTARAAQPDDEPTLDKEPGSPKRWTSRRNAVVVGAAVLLGAAAAAFFLTRSDAPDVTHTVLADSRGASERPLGPVAHATTLREMRATRPALQRAVTLLAAIETRAKAIDAADYRDAATGLVEAQRQTLVQLIAISSLQPSTLNMFPRLAASAAASIEQLESASSRVASLKIPDEAAVLPEQEAFNNALRSLRPVVSKANRQLAQWRAAYRKQKAKQRSDLALLDSYKGTMDSHLVEYDKLRTSMQDWVNGIDGSTTFTQAYDFLGEASSKRAAIRDALKLQSPPSGMGEAHGQLMLVITDSVDAVNAAYSGLSDYQYNRDDYDSYSDAPGWQEFVSSSSSLSSRYATAVAAWRSAFEKERKRTKNRALPRPPTV